MRGKNSSQPKIRLLNPNLTITDIKKKTRMTIFVTAKPNIKEGKKSYIKGRLVIKKRLFWKP